MQPTQPDLTSPVRTRRFGRERLAVLAGGAVASGLCAALELVREIRFGAVDYRFLTWHLALAWIPLLLALLLYDLYRRHVRAVILAPVALLWLLFLPNAPYILTDFVHLDASAPTPLWLDAALLSAFAWTGLVLGLISV